jgi:hypothetical protein
LCVWSNGPKRDIGPAFAALGSDNGHNIKTRKMMALRTIRLPEGRLK